MFGQTLLWGQCMVVHDCNSNTQEVKASLGYIARPYLRKQNKAKQNKTKKPQTIILSVTMRVFLDEINI
jgi:hypothetical protein